MIKNVSVTVSGDCNSRCSMCDIWRGEKRVGLSAVQFGELFSRPEFREVEDLSITGGEPTLRDDLLEVVEAIIANMDKLRMLFLCSNGTNPSRAVDFIRRFHDRIEAVYLAVSFEGTRESMRKIRGIDCYDQVLETMGLCRGISSRIHTILSATITPVNCNEQDLAHLKWVADQTGSTYTFKPVVVNQAYYQNETRGDRFLLNREQLAFLSRFIGENCMDDPFMEIQLEYIKNGIVSAIDGGCLAGDVFAFVRSDGEINPCCNSMRKIGGLNDQLQLGVTIGDLGEHEPCPCCNEMCVYPMLNWANFSGNYDR